MPEAEGIKLSHHLGRALQLTNILRDIDDDAAINRCYLPRELRARRHRDHRPGDDRARSGAAARVRDARRARARALPPADAVMDTCARAGEGAAHHVGRVSLHSRSRDRTRPFPRTAAQAETRMLMIAARYALF